MRSLESIERRLKAVESTLKPPLKIEYVVTEIIEPVYVGNVRQEPRAVRWLVSRVGERGSIEFESRSEADAFIR